MNRIIKGSNLEDKAESGRQVDCKNTGGQREEKPS